VDLTEQIKYRKAALLADKPGYVRLSTSERVLKQCRAAVEAAAVHRTKVLEEVSAVHDRLSAADDKAEGMRIALLTAESEHELLLVALQAEGRNVVPPVTGMAIGQAASHLEAGTDEAWSKVGINIGRQALIDILRALETLPACQPGAAGKACGSEGPQVVGPGAGINAEFDVDLTGDGGDGAAPAVPDDDQPSGDAGPIDLVSRFAASPAAASSAVPSVSDILGMWAGSTAVNRQQLAEEIHSNLAKRRCLSVSTLPPHTMA
jgi:hypothetical protein